MKSDFDKMGRRKFLSASTMSLLGYSLMVSIPSKADAKDAAVTELGREIEDKVAGKSFELGAEPNMEKSELDCDVLVAGGGLTGVCAAIAAARGGAKTILMQDRSRLGGNSSSEIKMHPLGVNGEKVGWREAGILEELKLENSAKNPQMAWEMWDLVLYDKCVSEKNLTLLLDTAVYGADAKDGKINSVYGRSDHSLKIYKINAKQFIDCTGDARVAMEASATLMSGRDGSKKYGESLADTFELGKHLCASLIFTSKDCGKPTPFAAPSWAKKITEEDLKFRDPKKSGFKMGYWFISHGGFADTLRDTEVLRLELLAIVLGVWDYIKNSGKFPETANLALDTVGMIPAKRDTYRIEGEYIFKQQDIQGGWKDRPDQIAACGWPIEDQPSGGFYARGKKPAIYGGNVDYYNIPLASLVAKDLSNLMMAGRDMSSSHIAFASTRVMNIGAVCGQAAGTAAAKCVRENMATPKEILASAKKISELQQELLRDGHLILNVKNSDPLDIARKASATASASAEGTLPENVLSGAVFDFKGSGENKWKAPIGGAPWLKLEWDAPQKISSVILNFDTGSRLLTMTRQDKFLERIITGPQPESVRDYRLTAILADNSEKVIADAKGNYQKRVEHKFPTENVKALRLECLATNGSEFAGVYEIRAYA